VIDGHDDHHQAAQYIDGLDARRRRIANGIVL
jgi:hypothetical protein